MRRFKSIVYVISMMILFFSFFAPSDNPTAVAAATGKMPGVLQVEGEQNRTQESNESKSPENAVALSSGQTTEVPWTENDKFIKSQEKNDTLVLLAAYRTVLRDPLPGEEFNVHLAADMLAGIVLQPGEVFSQNGKIGPYTENRGFQKGPTYMGARLTTTIGGGVCKIASTLYNVTVLSDLQVVERHAHSMPVPYVPYGQDATVAYGARDFKFRNNTDSPLLIWAQGVDNILYIGFYGRSEPPKVEWKHETLKVIETPKEYRVNPSLSAGEEKLVMDGMHGAVMKSWVIIHNADGTTTTKPMASSYYNPFPAVYERGR